VFVVLLVACGANDNSSAVKAHSLVKPGMTLAEAFDLAESSQRPDLLVMANPKDCDSTMFQIGRHSGPRYIRVYGNNVDPKYPTTGREYREDGFASRQDFLDAVSAHSGEFLTCKSINFFLMRYQGWWSGDSFELTFDDQGKVVSVGPLTYEYF
jgi:hypothetical protein